MITNTKPPYCYDIAYALSLPEKFLHRFRYHAKWIHKDYKDKPLKGVKALLVLRNFDTSELMPARYVQIEDALVVGDIHYIEFQVSEYISTLDSATLVNKINERVKSVGFPNNGGEDLGCLVFELDHEPLTRKASGQEWGEVVRQVGVLKCYKDYGFLKIVHVRDSEGQEVFASPDETGKYSYCLRSATLYYIDIVQHIPWEIEKSESIEAPYDVELNTDIENINMLRKVQRVVGKYDLLRFIFKTREGKVSRHTFIEVQNRQSGEAAKYGLPALFLPVRVELGTVAKLVLIGRVVIGVFSVFILFASDQIGGVLTIQPDWIRALALFLLVMATTKWDEFVKALFDQAKEVKLAVNFPPQSGK